MHSLDVVLPPTDRPDPFAAATRAPDGVTRADPAVEPTEPPRVIEIGEVTAGIAVPEGRGVRFFSSARDFDGLDGAVFRNAEHAARAARERVAARARSGAGQGPGVEFRRRRA